jgi:glycosyltransferase involved in cell wall biosynthesis
MYPLVSIVIPTFERPDYLKEAVASALAQTYPNIEVLIGDNGAAGATLGWDSVFAGDPRVKYGRNPRNLGISGNFNALADAAQGEFLVAIGDDDRLLPEFASRLVEEMGPEVSLAFCNHYLIDNNGLRLEVGSHEETRRYGRDRLQPGVLESAQVAAWQQSVAISAALMRTADMRRLRFREDLNTPDTEFFIRLAQEGAAFAFVPDYLAEYRVHAASTTSSGLCSERLVEYLLPLVVTPEVEPYKRKLLGPLIMNAVSRCLRRGEKERAKSFLQSHYYPRQAPIDLAPSSLATAGRISRTKRMGLPKPFEHAVKFVLQHFCAKLPAAIGCPTYRVLGAAKNWARS